MSGSRTESAGERAEGYRLPPETRVGRVRLRVGNLERSLGFYGDLLGLRVSRREPGVAGLSAAQGTPELLELRERPGARPAPQGGAVGLYHFALLLPDRRDLGRMLAHLREVGVPLGASDHLVSEALYVSDPDGNGLEIYADRPRGEWRWREGELQMSTAPLDAASLLRGAAPPRDGIHPGTTVGHVHLHVDHLGRAEAFYRGALGLDLTVGSYPGALFFAAGGYHHHLAVNTWASSPRPPGEDAAGLVDWELVLPDTAALDALVARLRARGYAPRAAEGGWTLEDPAGISLRLVAREG